VPTLIKTKGSMMEVQLKKIKNTKICLVISLFFICVYVVSYFGISDMYIGEFSGEIIKIRLFCRKFDLSFYRPMIYLEEKLRKGTFYVQVRSGASLPPAIYKGEPCPR
jgi:hypothetical protein